MKSERQTILYVRIKKSNKKWLEKVAKEEGFHSLSQWFDRLLDNARGNDKPRKK